jgi:hypothetical protein
LVTAFAGLDYYDEGAIVQDIQKYYGNGSEWIEI